VLIDLEKNIDYRYFRQAFEAVMRLVSFLKEAHWRPALRRADSIVEIADPDITSAQAAIAAVAQGRRLTEGTPHPLADVTLGLLPAARRCQRSRNRGNRNPAQSGRERMTQNRKVPKGRTGRM
jgi:hypothetical protein